MLSLNELKAGDFIDLESYLKEFLLEDYTNIEQFYKLIEGFTIEQYIEWLNDIKQTYYWIYDPPQMPTDAEQKPPTIGDEWRSEFFQDYGGYMEILYLLCKGDFTKKEEILNWNVIDFLYLGEYLLRKKTTENIK